ncbi:hypothetical protein KSP39_PZI022144 [Platanthera zijinensis]|uniref:Uncharacterized protein n=1 Tax=Platanthera zijinensis TaxID=2320716 RepID=A0AAP0AZA6_9ASPA
MCPSAARRAQARALQAPRRTKSVPESLKARACALCLRLGSRGPLRLGAPCAFDNIGYIVAKQLCGSSETTIRIGWKSLRCCGSEWPHALYDTLFMDVTCFQTFVTDTDFKNPDFRMQLTETVKTLISLRVVPIFNENDAISTRKAPYEWGLTRLVRPDRGGECGCGGQGRTEVGEEMKNVQRVERVVRAGASEKK